MMMKMTNMMIRNNLKKKMNNGYYKQIKNQMCYDFIRNAVTNNNPVKSNKLLMNYITNHNKEKRIDYILNHRISRISTLSDFIDDMFYLCCNENISTTIK